MPRGRKPPIREFTPLEPAHAGRVDHLDPHPRTAPARVLERPWRSLAAPVDDARHDVTQVRAPHQLSCYELADAPRESMGQVHVKGWLRLTSYPSMPLTSQYGPVQLEVTVESSGAARACTGVKRMSGDV
jgi:hypothetical protein